MQKQIKPSEITPYNYYRDEFPSQLDKHLRDSFYVLNDTLQTEKPQFIESMAIYSPVWHYKPNSINIFVFGGFRSRYKALVQTAEILAEFYLQNDYLPLVQPLTNKDWEIQVETDGRFFHSLSKSGMLIYSTEGI